MEKSKVDMFVMAHADKFAFVQSADLNSPSTILLIAIILGWERFWLDDIALGLLKILTCFGCGIWWIIDIITAKERTFSYNYKKMMEIFARV